MFDRKLLLQHIENRFRTLEEQNQFAGNSRGFKKNERPLGPAEKEAIRYGSIPGEMPNRGAPTGFALTERGVIISNPEHAQKINADRFIHVDEIEGINHLHDYAVGDGVKDTHKNALDKYFTRNR